MAAWRFSWYTALLGSRFDSKSFRWALEEANRVRILDCDSIMSGSSIVVWPAYAGEYYCSFRLN